MDTLPASSVAHQYQARLETLSKQDLELRRQDRLFIGLKISSGCAALCLAIWLAKYHTSRIFLTLVPLVLIILLFAFHERVLKDLRSNRQIRDYYERGVARLEDRWFTPAAAPGSRSATSLNSEEWGEKYLSDTHPYARDLDLFGPASLYHLLCTIHTRVGRDTLAAWLLTPASTDEILRRQAAIQELAPLLDFRERLVLAGAALDDKATKSGAAPEVFAQWAESTQHVNRHLRIPAASLAILWLSSVAAWQLLSGSSLFFLSAIGLSIVNLLFGYRHRHQLQQSAVAMSGATEEIGRLATVLTVLESQPFTSEKLLDLQASLKAAVTGEPVSKTMSRLARRLDWLSSSDNWFVKVLDPFIFWTMQCVVSVEDWRRLHGASVRKWLKAIGEIEALVALAVYTCEHPEDAFPTFTDEAPFLFAREFAHPLLPRDHAVRNTLKLDRHLQLIVISGPNMAGKSTFIRSVGVNVVLAQAGAPVRAAGMILSPLAVAASICILDSLQGGLSRFYAEILRLKEIDSLSRQPLHVLFLLDELLSGTNSHDRRIGTESMVRSLVARNAIGLVTTHDLALADIANSLEGKAANFHFEDRYEDGKLYFEYKLTPGIVQTSNALQLMRSIGLDV